MSFNTAKFHTCSGDRSPRYVPLIAGDVYTLRLGPPNVFWSSGNPKDAGGDVNGGDHKVNVVFI